MLQASSERRPRIAVVDDEPLILEAWKEILEGRYETKLFSDPLSAATYFETEGADVAVLDVRMPGMDGLALLERIKRSQPSTEVIMITGHGTIEMAVQAIQAGAYDFVCKPIDDIDAAIRRVDGALERRRLRELNQALKSQLDAYLPDTELIGDGKAIRKVRDLIVQVADSPAPVIICGESGTGKELAARALHLNSSRRDRPFVAINCAAMPETLIDSELFGHERGAFTGAMSSHKGLFEAANGGTLFLDEIGDIPLQTQVRLLRTLQDGEIRAVGATRSRTVDVRVIGATNVNLERAMREGRFREDFYYRISTFRIDLVPLRERREDIPLIATHILKKVADRANRQVSGFSDDALNLLMHYDWPGNVRELSNAIEHAVTLAANGEIDVAHLPAFVASQGGPRFKSAVHNDEIASATSVPFATARDKLVEDFERRYLADLLTVTGGNLSEAARRSGIDRSNLRRLLHRHSLMAATFKGQS